MWKRDQVVKPPNGQPVTPAVPTHQPSAPVPDADSQRYYGRNVANIGKSVVIKGEVNACEELTVEGNVEGTINLRNNALTIGTNGKIKAKVFAKSVIVLGEVTGDITASEKVEIRDGGSVEGDVVSPRVAIAEGARFQGSIDMRTQRAPAVPQVSAPAQHQPSESFGLTEQQPAQSMAAAAYY